MINRIVLGSKSPRRQVLLKEIFKDFTVFTKDVDESFSDTMEVEQVAPYLSKKKFDETIIELRDDDFLITADSVVIIDNRILNKPTDRAEAIEMLTLLSGNTHKVITGTTVGTQKSSTTFHDLTFVTFADMRPEEMEFYIDTFKPFDKAGAYGIQEWIGHVILQKIDGSFTNVMGLPVQMLYDILKKSFPELTKFMIP